jgi:hypothetical protein
MRGGSGSKIGRIGPGDKFSYTMGLRASMDHEGCRRPMAAMGTRTWRQSIQQLTNILYMQQFYVIKTRTHFNY